MRLLHLVIHLALLGRQFVGQGVTVVGWNVHAVFELVANDDVLQQAVDRFLGAVFVFPLDCFFVAADLGGYTDAVTESKERPAKPATPVKQKRLVPDISDAAAVGRAGHQPAVSEVLADLGHRLAALGRGVLVGARLVDDEGVEPLEEFLGLQCQPLNGISVGDIGVAFKTRQIDAVAGRRDNDTEVGREFFKVGRPGAAQQRLRCKDQCTSALFLATTFERFDRNKRFSCARIAGIENDLSGEVVFEGLGLVGECFGHLPSTSVAF